VADGDVRRKLAAILAADVAGYSRLMGDDERATIATLREYRDVFREHIEANDGRVVDMAGDSVLAVFGSAAGAVQAATETQAALAERNEGLPNERRMLFRIGVNLGDIEEAEDGTVYGDGVNVAARLEAMANPGGINVSGSVFDSVRSQVSFPFDFLGEHEVKNIAEPVRAYRVLGDGETANKKRAAVRSPRILIPTALALVALVAIAVWQSTRSPAPEELAITDDTLVMPKGPSILVLPFANSSGDAQHDYFVDGVTEEIITALTRFRELFVIAHSTSFSLRDYEAEPAIIARNLGVQYVLEGSVRRSTDKVRASARLIEAGTGANLWAESFERELTARDVFVIQDEITESVVAAIADPLEGAILQHEMATSRSKAPETLEAYDCVLLSNAYWQTYSGDIRRMARECLERVVSEDPQYSEAWAGLANMYVENFMFGEDPDATALDRALEAARRAVLADPESANTQWALARTHSYRNEVDAFYAAADRAVALNPNNATVLAGAGLHMSYPGRWERGTALVRKAMHLNPNHQGWYRFPLALDHFRKGDLENALAEAQKINIPGFYWTQYLLAAIYGQMGRDDEAHAAAERLMAVYPGFTTEIARHEALKLNMMDDLIELMQDGLRKAGIEDPAPATD